MVLFAQTTSFLIALYQARRFVLPQLDIYFDATLQRKLLPCSTTACAPRRPCPRQFGNCRADEQSVAAADSKMRLYVRQEKLPGLPPIS